MHPNILSHGSLSSIVKPIVLNAGGLSISYQSGFLRYIKWNDIEVIRMINYAVRDCDWGTVPLLITNEKIEANNNSFLIEYEARCQQDDIDFVWTCRIHGREDAGIVFDIVGKALTNFKRNRIGFTVLHPIDSCAGKACTLTHSDLKNETLQFPILISPSQPFFDVVAMAWKPSEKIKATLTFEGDIFETEDQRNWIDASYKTYCTPLSKPFPVKVDAGYEIKQTIRFQVHTTQKATVQEKKLLTFQLDKDKTLPFPKIGIPVIKLIQDYHTLHLINELQPDFLRVELIIKNKVDSAELRHAGDIISKVKCKLEVVLFFDEKYDLNFIDHLLPFKEVINHFIILSTYAKCTDQKLINQIVPQLRKYFPQTKIGAGTDAFFAELNRSRTPTLDLDFLTFSINPQIHAFDLNSLTENLAAHRDAVVCCSAFAGGKKVHVGPVTFKMRWNPNATSAATENLVSNEVPSHADPRQLSLYGAAWTLGSFKYLAESQVEAITFYQTCGWGGLMPHANEPWPEEYAVRQNCVYPMYFILMEILNQKSKLIVPLVSSDPLIFDGVAFVDHHGNETVIVVNYTNEEQCVTLPLEIKNSLVKFIDTENIEKLMEAPNSFLNEDKVKVDGEIVLNPFGVAIIEKLTQDTK